MTTGPRRCLVFLPSTIRRRVALVFGIVAVGLVVGLYWLVHFRTSVVPTGSLGQDDVREIVSAVSRKRWELIRTTATRREFKLLSRFLRARIEGHLSGDKDEAVGLHTLGEGSDGAGSVRRGNDVFHGRGC